MNRAGRLLTNLSGLEDEDSTECSVDPVRITDAALAHIRTMMGEYGSLGDMLRIRVVFVPSRQFGISIESNPPAVDDVILDYPGVRIVFGTASFELMRDTVIDYVQDAHGEGLKFSKTVRPGHGQPGP
jgi:Fe-S cluster assembly iron-binding protein IscA